MNVELAERAIKVAKANPEQFDMDDWVYGNWDGYRKDDETTMPPCGTTACFAGWVSFLAAPVGSRVVGSIVCLPDGDREHVGEYAEKVLKITPDQEMVLFYLDNIDQVEKAVKYLAENPGADYEALSAAARA